MQTPTSHYKALKQTIKNNKQIISRLPKDECISELQQLKVKSFVLLSHAAFEEYVEALVREVSVEAKKRLEKKGCITKAAVNIIASEAIAQANENKNRRKINSDINEIPAFLSFAVTNFHREISENHGIRQHNIKKLFLAIGVNPEITDIQTYNSLNSFAVKRGELAHSSIIRQEDTRRSVTQEVDRIVDGLKSFDKEAISQLKTSMI